MNYRLYEMIDTDEGRFGKTKRLEPVARLDSLYHAMVAVPVNVWHSHAKGASHWYSEGNQYHIYEEFEFNEPAEDCSEDGASVG